MRFNALLFAAACMIPAILPAQISGVINDAVVAQRRVPGAVITVLDSARRVITRAIADDSGRFRIPNAGQARRLRIAKIGYRPTELPVTNPATLRISLDRLPNLLEPVYTSGQPKCSRNPTRPAAFGLWEQARAALLGTVLARETNEAHVRRLNFRRYMTPNGDEIARQTVRRDSGLALRSFDASYGAAEFMARGFAEPEAGARLRFYGPDAEVLLDDALAEHYCLELAAPKAERRAQVGLRFRPVAKQLGRVDLDGTLWIDTAARVLKDIEYTYLGLEEWADRWLPGGLVAFKQTSPATVWIDRWWIRMTGAGIDSRDRQPIPAYSKQAAVVEGGAELSSARWPDGRTWNASLGTGDLTLVRSNGSRLRGARVQLDSTDYGGITDSAGRLVIPELLPGPYDLSVHDPTLAIVDTTLPGKPARFVAVRDSVTHVRAVVPTLTDFVAKGCQEHDAFDYRSPMVIARIVRADGRPAVGARWRLEPVGSDVNARDGYYGDGVTGLEGMAYFCRRLTLGKRVVLRAWPPGHKANDDAGVVHAQLTLTNQVTAVKLQLPP